MKNLFYKHFTKMYLLIAWLIIIMFMCSCTDNNEAKAIEWIKANKKPINCRIYGYNLNGDVSYTLISSDNVIYSTGLVNLDLPDTLK